MSGDIDVKIVVPSLEVLTNPEKAARCLVHARHAVERALELKNGAEEQAAYFLAEKERLLAENAELKRQLDGRRAEGFARAQHDASADPYRFGFGHNYG